MKVYVSVAENVTEEEQVKIAKIVTDMLGDDVEIIWDKDAGLNELQEAAREAAAPEEDVSLLGDEPTDVDMSPVETENPHEHFISDIKDLFGIDITERDAELTLKSSLSAHRLSNALDFVLFTSVQTFKRQEEAISALTEENIKLEVEADEAETLGFAKAMAYNLGLCWQHLPEEMQDSLLDSAETGLEQINTPH